MNKVVIASDFHVFGQASATLTDVMEKISGRALSNHFFGNPEYLSLAGQNYAVPGVDLSQTRIFLAGDRTPFSLTMEDINPAYRAKLEAIARGAKPDEVERVRAHFAKNHPDKTLRFNLQYPVFSEHTSGVLKRFMQEGRINPITDSGGNSCDIIDRDLRKIRKEHGLDIRTNNELFAEAGVYSRTNHVLLYIMEGKTGFLFIPYSKDQNKCIEYRMDVDVMASPKGIEHLVIITHENIAPAGVGSKREPEMPMLKGIVETAASGFPDSEIIVVCGHLHQFPEKGTEYDAGRMKIVPIGVDAKTDIGRYLMINPQTGAREVYDVVFKAPGNILECLKEVAVKTGRINETVAKVYPHSISL